MARAVLFTLGVIVLLAPAGFAREDDPIKTKLDKAKTDYDSQLDKLRAGLLKSLDDREDSARKAGNKKLVDQIKAEREAFESRGELPKSVPTTTYTRDTRSARTTLELAYGAAIKEYLKAKKDDEAAVAEKELTAFKESANAAVVSLATLLTKDSVWKGARRIAASNKGGKLNENPFEMKITARDGKGFKGHIVIDKTRKLEIEGLVDGDKITFETEKKGTLKHNYEGRLRGQTLELTFAGTGGMNEQVKGVVVLTLDKGK